MGKALVQWAAAAAAIAWALPAAADYKAGMEALAVNDYARARAEFESEPNNAQAVMQLARMARLGLGEPANPTRRAGLLQRAGELGSQEARYDYGILLANGIGIKADVPAAIRLFEELDAAGMHEATTYLAQAYRYGWWGTAQDHERSTRLLKRASDGGHDLGTALYAAALIEGRGTEADTAKGFALLQAGVEKGQVESRMEYARVVSYGVGGIARDEAGGAAMYRKVALETGDARAQFAVCLAHLGGRGVARDDAMAFRWCDAAARQGNAYAQVRLGDLYRFGMGAPKLRTQAYYWYTVAARSSGSAGEQARERRAQLAPEMGAGEIETQVRRAESFQAQPGLRVREEALPALSRGDRVTVGGVHITIPIPSGYVNTWELFEMFQRTTPNDPELQPRLMVLTLKDDVERLRLRLPSGLRSVEVVRDRADESDVTVAVFADLRRDLRARLDNAAQAGRYKVEAQLRDDDAAYATVRSSITGGDRVDGLALLLVKGKTLTLFFTGFTHQDLPELKTLVANTIDDVLSRNRGFSLFGAQ